MVEGNSVSVFPDTYEVIEQIGSGGGGTVFKAYHKRLKKYVVIKKIHAHITNEDMQRTEVDILKNLHHEYIPQVFDYFNVNGVGYTVMDYVDGESLQKKLDNGCVFSEKQVVKYAVQLCKAVSYLHSRKIPIIHGDIKPDNIMITPEDNICLIDFNISGVARGGQAVTYGYSAGYGAPEQYAVFQSILERQKAEKHSSVIDRTEATDILQKTELLNNTEKTELPNDSDKTELLNDSEKTELLGETRKTKYLDGSAKTELQGGKQIQKTDRDNYSGSSLAEGIPVNFKSDIYSIGATMYRLLSGFRIPLEEMKSRPISDVVSGISEGLAYVIEKAMSINPCDRFDSVSEMLDAIENYGKKDRRYVHTIVAEVLLCIFFIVLAVAFSVMAYSGYMRMCRDKADALYSETLNLHDEGKYEEALTYILGDVLEQKKYFNEDALGNIYYIAADSSYELEDYSAAADYYEKAISYFPYRSEYYINYVSALLNEGKDSKAQAVLEDMEKNGLGGPEEKLIKAELAAAEGKYADAAENYEDCILSSDSEDIRIKAFLKYSDMYEKQDGYSSNKEVVYTDLNILSTAKEMLKETNNLMRIDERLMSAQYLYGTLTNDVNYIYTAALTGDEIIEAGYDNFEICLNTALFYDKAGYYEESEEHNAIVVKKYGDNYIPYARLAMTEVEIQAQKDVSERDYTDFFTYYNMAVKLFNDSGETEDQEISLLEDTYRTLVENGWK